jgi:hypothetical protein|eukprot:COSAG06_NODE_4404_length_4293_cov_4.212685_3_plen_65_part_00
MCGGREQRASGAFYRDDSSVTRAHPGSTVAAAAMAAEVDGPLVREHLSVTTHSIWVSTLQPRWI